MRSSVLLLGALILAPFLGRSAEAPVVPDTSDAKIAPGLEKSIVKIFVTSRGPEVYKPWTKGAPKDTTASGVVIDGKLILTTARAVEYSNEIEIQANQSGDKLPATIALFNRAMNLAVLRLDDDSFFDTHPAVPIEQGLPSIKDPILVYGFPVGGSSLSITKGIISRIEFSGSGGPDFEFRIQIDAAINEGNSGGPAVAGGKIVGLALGHLNNAENIGYIIPNEEIILFLRDLQAGKPKRDPAFYDFWQTLENGDLRKSLGLTKDVEGIVIQDVADKDPSYPLRPWDVIEKVGTYPVDDQGMVHVGALRLDFRYAVRKEAKDGHIPMVVVRQGKTLTIDVPLGFRHMLVPGVEGFYPPYFILGPIAFTRATQAFAVGILESKNRLGSMTWDRSPIIERRGDTAAFPDEELVVVPSPFFPNKLAVGYKPPSQLTVATVNGIPVKNLEHLVEILRDAKTDYITFRFAERYKEALVFSRADLVASTDSILADNGIRSQGSPELMNIWNSKPSQ